MDFPLKLDNTPSINQVFTPVNIAILASLGLHAFVLGLALPNLTWPETTEEGFEDRAPVGVIELTPAEQSRLPNTDPLPTNPLLPVFPGDASPPSSPTAPDLPAAPDSNYNYQLPDSTNLPPLPSMPPLPNLPAYPNLPPLTSYGNLSRLPIQNPPLPSLPPLPSRRLPRLPSPSTARLPESAPAFPSNDPARPRFEPLPPPQGTDFITKAPQGQDNANGAANINGNGVNPPALPTLIAEGEDSSPDQVQLNSLNSIAKQGVAIKAKDVIPGVYPQIACRNRTEASVIYNVFPSGQKDLVGRSRYPIFNDLAAKAIGDRSYTQPTQVTVSFQYNPEVCAGVTQFASPQTPPAPQAPADPRPPVTPSPPPTDSVPSPTVPVVPGDETPSAPPTSSPPRPARPPAPTQQPGGETPTPQAPSPQPSPVPDVPAPGEQPPVDVTPQPTPAAPRPTPTPRPAVTPPPESQPRSTPTVKPTPSVAPVPASPPPQRSLPQSKGDILRKQNQAPFVPPSPQRTPDSPPADSPQSRNQPPWNQ